MKQIWVTRAGEPKVLSVRETSDPTPGPGEVTIDVKYVGVNFVDLVVRMGTYPDAPRMPCVIGFEVSGVVRDVGPGVTRTAPGDRVMAITNYGGYTTVATTAEGLVFPMPAEMTFEHGAALPVAYLTAYVTLFTMAGLRKGERVLIHSAGGGVGIAAVQLARTQDAEIFGTASSVKHDYLRAIGVHHPIDYRQEDYEAAVRRLTDGRGVDVILNALGGKSLHKDQRILADLGRIVMFGISSAVHGGKRSVISVLRTVLQMPRYRALHLINHNQGVYGVNLGRVLDRTALIEDAVSKIIALYQDGTVLPEIARVFPFDEAGAAHTCLHERRNIGKVLLAV